MIFRGILEELTTGPRSARPRLEQAMRDAIFRYLEPVLTQAEIPRPGSRQSGS